MDLEFDPAKDAANVAKHGVSLSRAADFLFQAVQIDARLGYGEPHCLAFVLRNGVVRPISLRRAHTKEYRRHVP